MRISLKKATHQETTRNRIPTVMAINAKEKRSPFDILNSKWNIRKIEN